jgi:hypothetical protein
MGAEQYSDIATFSSCLCLRMNWFGLKNLLHSGHSSFFLEVRRADRGIGYCSLDYEFFIYIFVVFSSLFHLNGTPDNRHYGQGLSEEDDLPLVLLPLRRRAVQPRGQSMLRESDMQIPLPLWDLPHREDQGLRSPLILCVAIDLELHNTLTNGTTCSTPFWSARGHR